VIIRELENDFIKFTLNEDASAEIFDKKRAERWHMGRVAYQEDNPVDAGHFWLRTERSLCEEYPANFRVKAKGKLTEYTLLGRLGQEMGTFDCEWRLAGEWVEAEVSRIGEELPCLMFPTPIVCDALVLPMQQGRLIRTPANNRYAYRFGMHLNMRWFGGLRGDRGWMALVDEGHEDAGALYSSMHITPMWLKSLGQWRGKRIVRYRFTEGGYVGMAKAFRSWAKEHGLFKSLTEKIDQTPALGNLIGGPMMGFGMAGTFNRKRLEDNYRSVPEQWQGKSEGVVPNFTYAQVKTIFEDAKKLGMKRGFLFMWGWTNGGHDELHPDIWPPEPALGSVDELAELCRLQDPYVTGIGDQYEEIYEQAPSFPKGCCLLPNGKPFPAGIWGGGQAYGLNHKHSVEYAKRNWRKMQTLNPRFVYLDATTASELRESWAKDDTLTRTQCEHYKKKLFSFWKEQGLVIGSENGTDWGIPYTDLVHNSFGRTPGESIPLWSLVYHDALFTCHGGQLLDEKSFGQTRLKNMLWGQTFEILPVSPADWDGVVRHQFSASLDADRWQGRTCLAEMTNHKFLTSECQVEQTEFSSGGAIAVNFGSTDIEIDGVKVPANRYAIRD